MPSQSPVTPWSDWPLIDRGDLDRIMDLLGRNPAGIALIGNEGVGKTTLAEQAAARLGGGAPIRVIGTLAQASVPFGAFGPLLAATQVAKPAEMIASAAESIRAQAGSAPIIVDNARLLDPLSASLLYHVAREGSSPVIVTVRSVLRVPAAVSALWNDGLLESVDVIPLDGAQTAALVAAAGSAADPDEVYRRSAGNPLHIRLALATGGGEETLAGAVDRYLAESGPAVRGLLGYLCVYEPLSRRDLTALTSADALAGACDRGAVHLVGTGESALAYAGHPLFLERLATTLDRAEVHRLRAEVAGQLASGTDRSAADRLGRTLLALQAEVPLDPAAVVGAAQEALRLGDLSLAERLAEGAVSTAVGAGNGEQQFAARLALSYALAWQGRGREADAALAAVDAESLSEEQLMAWALPRAANQFWMLSEPERAAVFLQTVRGRVGTVSSRLTLDALSATFAMNAGNVRRAAEVAGAVLDRPDAPEMAVAWAASAAALSSARMGRLDDVGPLVRRALAAEYPGLLRFTIGFAETTELLMNGQTAAAREAAQRFTDFAELAQPGRAIGEVLLAQVLLSTGDVAAAAELLGPAAAILERTGYSWGPLALTYLATALAHQGEIAGSAIALRRAQSRHGTKSGLFAPELGIARAWRLVTIGDRPGAVTAARDAARLAARAGQFATAVWCWHEATRLGDRRAAAGMAQAVEGPDGVRGAYAEMALAHARALTAGDAAGLAAAAERLAAAGFHGAADDAARQARESAGSHG